MTPNSDRGGPRSRRELVLGMAALGGSALVLGACGGDDDKNRESDFGETKPEKGDAARDIAVLNAALDLEHTFVAAYGAAEALLPGEARGLVRDFRDQEGDHVYSLTQAIRDLGGRPNRPRRAAQYRSDFPSLRTREDALRFALDLEMTAIAAYVDAVPKLTSGQLRATAASIVTTEAEHAAVLRGELGEPQLPSAFVTGQAGAGA
jgi:rubrerythrin